MAEVGRPILSSRKLKKLNLQEGSEVLVRQLLKLSSATGWKASLK